MDEMELDKSAWLLASGQELPAGASIPKFAEAELRERATRHVYRTAVQPFLAEPDALFEAMQRTWLASRSNREANHHGLALAHAHNLGQANGLRLAIAAIDQGADLFTVIRMLSDAMPAFEQFDVSDLLQFFEAVYPRTKNDLANGIPYNAAGHWMALHPENLGEILAACLANPSPALAILLRTALLRTAVTQSAKGLETIHDLLSSDNKYIALPAIEALGLVDWTSFDRAEVDRALAALRSGLTASEDDTVISASLAALCLVRTSPEDHALIDEVAALDKPFIVKLVGDQLAYRTDANAWIPEKVMLLAGKAQQNPNSYGGVDYVLSQLYENIDTPWDPIPWLNAWVLAAATAGDEVSVPKLFPQLFSVLCKDQDRLSTLVVSWVMHQDLAIQHAARDILDELVHVNHPELRVPPAMIDPMSEPELVHLVRRLLGNVFRDEQMVSLIWSMTDTQAAETRTFGLVYAAITSHVGYNYPHATEVYLQRVISGEGDTSLSRLAISALQKVNLYLDEISALPRLEELKSPDDHRLRYLKANQRAMNKAYEEANKGSFVELFATKIPLKAGRSSFSARNGNVGEKMHLSSFSHSMTLPRSESIDSVGSAIERFHFQIAKVGDK